MTDTRFIEKFEENVRLYPDKVILRDSETSLTFKELDEASGRVYAYLKAKGIGKEDFVMISLPHGVLPYIAMIGVWKAGAALVMSDVDLPIDRRNFIFEDCRCNFFLDISVWDDVMAAKSFEGYEITSVHDACYASYTSGSEGHPKGVLLEYGILEYACYAWPRNGHLEVPENCIELMPFSLTRSAAVMSVVFMFANAIMIDVAPTDLMYKPLLLLDYLKEHKISIITLTKSYYTKLRPLLNTPDLKIIQLAMEPANDVYDDTYTLVNIYGQTESFVVLSMFVIDKCYDVTPIGIPAEEYHVVLLDDEGNPVKAGEIGELCYENPYTRGYVGSQEQNRQVMRRSGDIARINEDGNYVILGRKTDMIKINGNRIEPAEIEAAVKRVLGIEWAFAKGFVEEDRSFICVYYTADITIDYTQVREELMRILPNYMIPSYFVHIDEIPHLPNGKINRQAFLAPDIEQYKTAYSAPTNELEQMLCDAMQQVLGIERVGINDDFFLLGGDSLRTIRLVTTLGISDITVADIYQGRIPQCIANTWMEKQMV